MGGMSLSDLPLACVNLPLHQPASFTTVVGFHKNDTSCIYPDGALRPYGCTSTPARLNYDIPTAKCTVNQTHLKLYDGGHQKKTVD
jgi:hypothetical protein